MRASTEIDLNQVHIPLQWDEIFGSPEPPSVEVGVGKGRFLLEMAAGHPERSYLGIERAAKYHKMVFGRTGRRGLQNIRLLRTTAEDLLFRLLPASSIAALFVFFPDPWPKKRHHKRRLFSPGVVERMRSVLVPGGDLLVKTDHPEYAEVIGEVLAGVPGLAPLDAEAAFAGLPLTSYELKYQREGRPIAAFAMRRSAGEESRG